MQSNRFEVPEGAKPYTAALKELCHTGAVSWAPQKDNVLLTFPRDPEGELDAAGVSRHRAALIGALNEILDSQMEGDFRARCLALLGLGQWAGQPLGIRREFVGKNYPSLGRDWEGVRKEPFDHHLLTLFLRLEEIKYREVEALDNTEQNAFGWELVQYFSRLNIATGETLQRRMIRATRDGLTFWEVVTNTTGRPDETVSLITPGALSRHSEGEIVRNQPGKSYIFRVDFPKPLKRGEEFEIELLRREQPNLEPQPGSIHERHLTPRTTTHRATFEVIFPKDRMPSAVWAFSGLAEWLLPGVASAGTELMVSAEGVARFSWAEPAPTRAHGIAWEW